MILDVIQLTSEAIENGYNYENILDILRKQYHLSDSELFKIYSAMKAHNMELDSDYMQFSKTIRGILEGEDIHAIQAELAKSYSDYIRSTAPWILTQD